MNDREAIFERVLLVALGCAVCVVSYVGCQHRPKTSIATIPTPPAQPAVTSESFLALRATAALAPLGMTLSTLSVQEVRVVAQSPYQGRGQITLAWDASPSSEVVGYRVYYGTSSGMASNSVSVGKVTKVTITDLLEGVPYYFTATAVDGAGNESISSNEAIGTPGFYVSIRTANWSVEAYGRAGATNLFLRSSNMVDWVVIKEFIGVSGVLQSVIEPNNTSAWYRVRVKP